MSKITRKQYNARAAFLDQALQDAEAYLARLHAEVAQLISLGFSSEDLDTADTFNALHDKVAALKALRSELDEDWADRGNSPAATNTRRLAALNID